MLVYCACLLYLIYRFIKSLARGKCRCKERMDKKTVIITGGHKGVGYETAKNLAMRGARVIIACRDLAKGALARDKIIAETLNDDVYVKYLNLASFRCIANFSNDILRTENRLHVLVHNVVLLRLDSSLTVDDLPLEVQINHFGPFMLTVMLLPLLKASQPSRIVIVSSVMQWVERMEMYRYISRPGDFMRYSTVYANMKIANLLFTKKLSQKLRGTGVTANSLHPGIINTDVMKNSNALLKFIVRMFFRNSRQGAQTIIHACVAPELVEMSGKYLVECKVVCRNYPYDQRAADKLWSISENICRIVLN